MPDAASLSDSGPQLSLPTLRALYGYWAEKRRGRPMPDRADIDPIEMRPWLGHLMLVERKPDGDYIYRLYGSAFVDQFKVDMTGQAISTLPAAQAELLRAEYDAVVNSAAPTTRQYTAQFESTSRDKRSSWAVERSWERLVLPLSNGGSEVGMLLVAAYPIDNSTEN